MGRHQFDVLLLDLMMPRMNGHDVISQMTAMTIRPVVIVISAAPEEQKLDPLVVHAVVRKPFDVAELAAIIRSSVMVPA